MKKLMCALAAVAAGVAVADVTSANIVGYNTTTVKAGYSIVTPAFEGVGADFAINGLQVLDAKGDADVTIQVFNEKGRTSKTFMWLNEYYGDDQGWYTDASGATPADLTLKPGEAVYMYTPYDITIQGAGQVSTEIEKGLNLGYTLFGNGTPVDRVANDFQVTGPQSDADVTIQVFNEKGRTSKTFMWLNEYYGDDQGWYTDASGATPADLTLKPGESLYFYSPISDVKVTLTPALTK